MGERALKIEVVAPVEPSALRARRLGMGLLLSLPVGWSALTTAIADPDAFEASVARFLLAVAISVAGMLFLGALYDRFTAGDDPDPAGAVPASAGSSQNRDDE